MVLQKNMKLFQLLANPNDLFFHKWQKTFFPLRHCSNNPSLQRGLSSAGRDYLAEGVKGASRTNFASP